IRTPPKGSTLKDPRSQKVIVMALTIRYSAAHQPVIKMFKIQVTLVLLVSVFSSQAALLDSTSDPSSDPADLTAWPNQTSRANSDAWLVENHDRIRLMRPRVLLLNFSQEASRAKLEQLTSDLFAALKESSRYHGYTNPKAPAFLDYQVFKFV